MNSMRKLLLSIPLLALLSLVGCKGPQTFGGTPRTKVYRAVISISPSTTELCSLFGVNLVGRSKADNYPPVVSNVATVADLKPDYEAITRLKPDLIMFDRDLYGTAEVEKLKATGAEIMQVGSDTVDAYEKELYTIANKLGGEMEVSSYLEKVHKQRQSSEGDKFATTPKAVMIIADASGHHMIAGVKSFQADLMKIFGATPIGPDSNKFEMLSPEFLISQNPDVIIVAGDEKPLIADTRFANLKAIKEKKYFSLDQDIVIRRGSRVDTCIYEGHKKLALAIKGN